jgi:hypothetical protein
MHGHQVGDPRRHPKPRHKRAAGAAKRLVQIPLVAHPIQVDPVNPSLGDAGRGTVVHQDGSAIHDDVMLTHALDGRRVVADIEATNVDPRVSQDTGHLTSCGLIDIRNRDLLEVRKLNKIQGGFAADPACSTKA